MNKPNFYDLLKLPPEASREEIRAAWLRECKLHHPDRGGSESHMALLNKAYETLSDPDKRAAYDAGEDPQTRDLTSDIIAAHLVAVFTAISNQKNITTPDFDLIGEMRRTLVDGRKRMQIDMRNRNTQLVRNKITLRRLRFRGNGINPIAGYLQQAVDTEIQNLQKMAEQRKGIKFALDYLDNYEWDFEPATSRPYPNYQTLNLFTPHGR